MFELLPHEPTTFYYIGQDTRRALMFDPRRKKKSAIAKRALAAVTVDAVEAFNQKMRDRTERARAARGMP